jgi:uncharacterized protein (UPF0335 family)
MPDEATITISSGGNTTGPIPMSAVKGALKQMKSDRDPKTKEMFTDAESGVERYHTVAAGQLRAFIERIERLEEEKKTIADDIKDIYGEAKGTGFDTKAIRTIVSLRKKDPAEREEAEAIVDLYKAALGMA